MSQDVVRAEPTTACFAVRATAEPGSFPRLLEHFAKRGLTPSAIHARVTGETLQADLQVVIEPATAQCVAESLRQMVMVERVLLAWLDAPALQAAVR